MWPWYDIEMFESNHGLQKCQISTSHPGDWHDYNIATWNVLASLIDSWKVFIPKCVKTLRSFLLTWRLVQRKDTAGNTFLFAKSSQLRAAEVWCQGMWMFHLHRTTRTPHACLPPELVNLFAASSLQTWFRTSSLKLVSFEHLVPKWGGKKQFVRINKRAKTLVKVLDVCVPPSQSPYSPDCQAEEPMGELTFCVAKVKRSDCLSPEVQRVLTKISAALHLVISVFWNEMVSLTQPTRKFHPLWPGKNFPPRCTTVDWQCAPSLVHRYINPSCTWWDEHIILLAVIGLKNRPSCY